MESKHDENIVMVGNKPVMVYVHSLSIQFEKNDEVIIYSRGMFIPKACNIVEIFRRNFPSLNVSYKDIKIDSQNFIDKSEKEVIVSSLVITLIKEKK